METNEAKKFTVFTGYPAPIALHNLRKMFAICPV